MENLQRKALRLRRQLADHGSARIQKLQNRRSVGGNLNHDALATFSIFQLERYRPVVAASEISALLGAGMRFLEFGQL